MENYPPLQGRTAGRAWERLKGDQLVSRVTFKEGKLVREKESPLPAYEKGEGSLPRKERTRGRPILKRLNLLADFDYPDAPFQEVLEDLHERFNLLMYFDVQAKGLKGFNELPILANEKQMPLHDCLSRLAREHGLTFDYQFHALWLTTPDSLPRKDTTGISDLKLPPDNPLAKALPEIPKFDFFAAKLQDLPKLMKEHHGLTVDVSKVPEGRRHPRRTPDGSLEKKLPLRHALGISLTIFNCRCREEGGKLIIEPVGMPPKEKAEPAKEKPAAAGHRVAPVPAFASTSPLGPAPLRPRLRFPRHLEKHGSEAMLLLLFWGRAIVFH